MSDRSDMVAAVTAPGILAVLSMEDTLLQAQGSATVVHVTVTAARAALAAVHGEPSDMDRARWKALDPAERKAALAMSRKMVLAR